jgi:hypothetical protein
LGAGVGASVDALIPGPYQAQTCSLRPFEGDEVLLLLRNGARVEGDYVRTEAPTARDPETYVVVDTGDGEARVPESEIATFGLEVAGKGWLYGALIGLAVDVAVVITVYSVEPGSGGNGSWGSNSTW